jgi:small subunit ribosomal protein S6
MSLYESVIIARQDISATQVEALIDQLTAVLSENGGEVKKREMWGLRNLAYRVKKNRKGHYVLLNIDGPSAAIDEYERQMRINEDILRYMTVRVEEHEEGPSVMMQPRNDRGERGGRGGRRNDRGDRAQAAEGDK